jgi:hypothetical protein
VKWRKYIAVFLAAYMLVLLCMPCKDNCNTSQHKTPSTYAAAQDHHHEENDQCSPFCFCACCATSITVVAFPKLEISLQINIEKFSVYTSSFVSEVNSSIWQPPKID